MAGMIGQSMLHLKCDGVVDHHGGMLSASRKSPAVMRKLEKPNLFPIDGELQNIPQWELVSIAHVIGKE